MNDYLTRLMLRMSKRPVPEYLMRLLLRLIGRLNPDLLFSTLPEQFPLAADKSLASQLDEIPSETSPAERRFLYRYFSMLWRGDDDVIEIGPFLGGTTRAIALGMCANPLASPGAKLYTYDRFHGYYDITRLKDCLAPLVMHGLLEQSDLSALNDAAEFMDIFRKIHAPYEYYERIVPVSSELPSRVEDLKDAARYFHIGEDIRTEAVFVDGCKSWFGTKHFMSEVSKAARRGATFIFQDYGWHTCFWIPAFLELLKDHFMLVGRIHTTYVFTITKSLDIAAISARFPDTPQEVGAADLVKLFDGCEGDEPK